MKLKSLILTIFCCSVLMSAWAQKTTATIVFSREDLPAMMLAYLNNATSDKEKQLENSKLMNTFSAAYSSMDAAMQDRVVGICNTMVKVKVRQFPDVCNFLSTLSTFYQEQ